MNYYVYVTSNPINYTDPSGLCSFQNSDCRQFVNDVRFIINTSRSRHLGDWPIVTILADWYAGIESTTEIGSCTVWLPFNLSPPTNTIERHPVFAPSGQEAGWPYDMNKMEDTDDPLGAQMRAQYGFKRPYYQNTHHYFAVFYIEYLLGFGGSNYAARRDERALRQHFDELPQQFDRENGAFWDYEALWIDLYYDAYVNEKAAEHARFVLLYGLDRLPQLIESEMCADSDPEVWSLQETVFTERYQPAADLTPWWERMIPIPGLNP